MTLTNSTNALPIIHTKLHRPQVAEDLVARPRLLGHLHRRQRPLTLVSAPAGYGKTTLVSSWLDTMNGPQAWLSLDEDDNDLILFVNYFLVAIRSMFPNAAQDTLALINAPEQPPLQALTQSLVNELNQIEVDFVVVLDNYYNIEDLDIHDLIFGLLGYPPPTMHLVLSTRFDPPLDLVNLREKSTVTEIRAQDLQFNQTETSAYLRLLLNKPVDEETVVSLLEKSEGWVPGIRLLARSMTNNTNALPIIHTKLHRPQVTEDLVARPRLLEHLHSHRQRPLALVSAPAGYGKTTLVSSWLNTMNGRPHAWVSLDEHDNDLILFLNYFLVAIRSLFPDAVENTLALVNAPEQAPVQVLTHSLLNDLNQITVDFVVVLDDYHNIQDLDIHDLISGLLRYPPPTMKLVLTTRSDPPLDLVTMRARSTISEIRAMDLRFNQAEVSNYLRLLLNGPVDEETVGFLSEKSEGWVTGIRLLALSLRQLENVDWSQIDRLENNHMVEDYLMSIILSLQEPVFEACLLKTAVLNRFCASLCQAVCSSDEESGPAFNGEAFIQQLTGSNLFVVPLDTQRHWFRYHHLFRDMLSRQLEKREGMDFIASLHLKASNWYAQNGYIEEALRHALAAGDTEAAVELVAQHRRELMNHEQWHTLNHWLRLFPHQLVEKDPELLVTRAWILYNRSQNFEMVAVLDRAETLLARNASKTVATRHHQAEIDAMRCEYVLVYEVDSEQAVALARRALSEIPHDWFNVRGLIYVILGYGYLMLGEPKQGFEIIYDVLTTDKSGSSAFRSRLLTALCYLHYSNADVPELGQAARRLLKLGQKDILAESTAYARYFLGCYYYLRNELVEAERYLVAATSDHQIAHIWCTINSVCVLALTYQALDKPDQARDIAGTTINFLAEMENVEFQPQLQGLQAELALRQEHLDEAGRWARKFDPYPLPSMVAYYIPQLTQVKVLLALDTANSRKQAADLLAKLYDHVLNDKRFMIEVLALQALLDDAEGDQVGALDKLERAIQMAEPGGFIRIFVDLGLKMAGLLRQLRGQGIAPHYINQILNAFGPERPSPSQATESSQTTGPDGQSSASGELIESLTNREFDVLTLMAQGLTNKEIAAQLVISPGTVTQYTHIIYQKLVVKNRRQAVIKATKLGILPRD